MKISIARVMSRSRNASNGLPSKEPSAYDTAMKLLALITAFLVAPAQAAIARIKILCGAMSGKAWCFLIGPRMRQGPTLTMQVVQNYKEFKFKDDHG